jgi:hypothetical protein
MFLERGMGWAEAAPQLVPPGLVMLPAQVFLPFDGLISCPRGWMESLRSLASRPVPRGSVPAFPYCSFAFALVLVVVSVRRVGFSVAVYRFGDFILGVLGGVSRRIACGAGQASCVCRVERHSRAHPCPGDLDSVPGFTPVSISRSQSFPRGSWHCVDLAFPRGLCSRRLPWLFYLFSGCIGERTLSPTLRGNSFRGQLRGCRVETGENGPGRAFRRMSLIRRLALPV